MSRDNATWQRAFGGLKGNRKPKESKLHEQVVNYLRLKHPNVRFISSLTGEYNSNHFTNARNSALQFGPGQPDLLIIKQQDKYCGLALELKRETANPFLKNGQLRKSAHLQRQWDWLMYLRAEGWDAHFSCGLDASIKLIDNYL